MSKYRRLCVLTVVVVFVLLLAAPAFAVPNMYEYKNCYASFVRTESYASGHVYHKHGGPTGSSYTDGYWYHPYNDLHNTSTTENATTWRAQASGKLFDYPWTFGYCAGGPS